MFALKLIFVLGLCLMVDSSVPGGATQLSGNELKEAEDTLRNSLSKLASGDGPNYQVGKIISASRMVVSGTKYIYKVELIDGKNTKTCNVEIWSQPWLENGNEVTFDCPDGKVVKKHST